MDSLPPLWSDDFEGADGPIQDHRADWIHVFGQVNLSSDAGGAVADPGTEDGDDDYAYRAQPASDLLISAHVYWDPADGVGIELICPRGQANESLYELTIYQDRLQLLRYDGGGDPTQYAVLENTRALALEPGEYHLALRARHDGRRWRLVGELRSDLRQDPIATVGPTRDGTHGPSIGQGLGIYNRSEELSRVLSMRVEGV